MDERFRILAARLIWVFVLISGVNRFAAAQSADPPTVGDCETGTAEAFLDVGNVRAKILNNGSQFWVRDKVDTRYEVPKGTGLQSIFAMSLLMGGIVDGELHTTGTTYGPYEFWPGPIPVDGSAPTDCERFDRLYRARSIGGERLGPIHGVAVDSHDWPAELGAPFVDMGGTPETYDPNEGDYPAMLGDEMLWWIMNDRGNEHGTTKTPPLSLDVRASAFAFDTIGPLSTATFYRYRVRNRSDRPIRSAYVGLYHDVDLGAAFDDYLASDTTTGTAYFYNADDDDDGSYGQAPPAIGFTVLKRPRSTIERDSEACSYSDGKSTGYTSHMQHGSGGGATGQLQDGGDVYSYLQGQWKDGTSMTVGGYGYQFSLESARFVFPGDPVNGEFWSEMNADGEGTPRPPADRRSVGGVGPFCLGPGDETDVVFAIVWARGDSNLDSTVKLRWAAKAVHDITDDILTPRVVVHPEPEAPHVFELAAALYPNPAVESATLRLAVPQPMDVRIGVFDPLGREKTRVKSGVLLEGLHHYELSVADWLPGAYIIRIQLDHITETRTLVVRR